MSVSPHLHPARAELKRAAANTVTASPGRGGCLGWAQPCATIVGSRPPIAPVNESAARKPRRHGVSRWSMGALALALATACSSRTELTEVEAEELCEDLSRGPESSGLEVGQLAALEDVVWLVTEPPTQEPLVVNVRARRIAGRPARLIVRGQRHWLLSDAHALSLEGPEPGSLEGTWTQCDKPGSSRHYVAGPLAPAQRSEPAGLIELGRFPTRAADWPEERTSNLALVGSELLAVARGPDGVRLLQRRPEEKTALEERGWLPAVIGDDLNDVAALDGRYLAVASKARGLLIVDVSDPSQPRTVADYLPSVLPRDGHSVTVVGTRLYLAQAPATGTGAVVAFDVEDPKRPRQLWRWEAAEGQDAHDLTVSGQYLYVSSLRGGITVLRSTSGEEPTVFVKRRGLAAHSCSRLSGSDERLLWGEEAPGGSLHLVVVNQSGPTASVEETPVRSWFRRAAQGANPWVVSMASPHHSECTERACFLAHYQLGLRVLDVATLGGAEESGSGTALLASWPTWQASSLSERTWLRGAVGVALDLPWVYVADTQVGVLALRYTPTTERSEGEQQ